MMKYMYLPYVLGERCVTCKMCTYYIPYVLNEHNDLVYKINIRGTQIKALVKKHPTYDYG